MVLSSVRTTDYATSFRASNWLLDFHSQSGLVYGHSAEVDFKKKERLFVRHEGQVGNVDVRVADGIELVIHIEEQKSMRGCMGRQNFCGEHH